MDNIDLDTSNTVNQDINNILSDVQHYKNTRYTKKRGGKSNSDLN